MKYRLPPRFYDDHVSRDLPGGSVLKRTKTYVIVELNAEEEEELRSDATYYYEAGVNVFGIEYRGLIASAKATLEALVR